MESNTINAKTPDGSGPAGDGLQKARPLHGRTSGPTRRSTKGQWTPEQDDILQKAVQRFKGKNWKKIAECFKDRTDVQCLHRWQKVLNPDLVKGPWTKEEDEIIIDGVNKYGPKKWSSIASHLPGRIGKQCRERWHNHLNPGINKKAWTQEEELILIRAHQIYGNKWAELTKFLPGRTDNSIKNHWNSSVKKKLESYSASGLLSQFEGLPSVGQLKQLKFSASMQQNTGDDCVQREETEEISESSEGSTVVGCSQSASGTNISVVHPTEDAQKSEELGHIKCCSSSLALCSENYHTALQEVACSTTDIPLEFGSSSKFDGYAQQMETGKDLQLYLNELPRIPSPDLGQESSDLFMHCLGVNEDPENVSFSLQTPVGLNTSAFTDNTILGSDNEGHVLTSEDGCCRGMQAETECDVFFPCEIFSDCSHVQGVDGPSDQLIYLSSNFHFHEVGTSSSEPNCLARSEVLGTSFLQYCPLPLQLPNDDGAFLFGIEHNQINDSSLRNQEDKLFVSAPNVFIYKNDSITPRDDHTGNINVLEQPSQAKDSSKLVPLDDFGSGGSNDTQTFPSSDKKQVFLAEQQQYGGALFYEPPCFPSSDVPFVSCDLVQSGSDMLQEYSPLGIRQLMMSSMNCFTPFKLWESPSRDDSPEAVLKSAAKTFLCTPSILKKRHRDLVSPLSEKRSEKKLDSDLNPELFSDLTIDFSRLEVMFDEKGNQKAYMPSPLLKHNGSTLSLNDSKESLSTDFGLGEGGTREGTADKGNNSSVKCFDTIHPPDGIMQKDDADTPAQIVQRSVLSEHNMNDLLFFSPEEYGIKPGRILSPSARVHGIQLSRRFDDASNECTVSSLTDTLCVQVISPFTGQEKRNGSEILAVTSVESAPLSTSVENMAEIFGNDVVENLNIFGETPSKRNIESPSAWKSPWFISSFLPGPRLDTDITVEDIGYFMSPGERGYDAIGLMKQLRKQNADTFADAQEILGDETPETILKERCSKNRRACHENNYMTRSQMENRSHFAPKTEQRVLDFSECGTPRKKAESGGLSATITLSSPTSYLLKSCRQFPPGWGF